MPMKLSKMGRTERRPFDLTVHACTYLYTQLSNYVQQYALGMRADMCMASGVQLFGEGELGESSHNTKYNLVFVIWYSLYAHVCVNGCMCVCT